MNKESAFLLLSIILGIIVVAVVIVMVLYMVLYYKFKNKAQALADYAYRMVNQTQNVINATTKVRGFYKKYTYFDENLDDENAELTEVKVSISGKIGGSDVTTTDGDCTDDYDSDSSCTSGVSGQIYRQYDVSELLTNLGISNYFAEKNANDATNDAATDGNYLEFSYQYPSDGPTTTMHFDLPNLTSDADSSTVITAILKNWRNAMFEHQAPSGKKSS